QSVKDQDFISRLLGTYVSEEVKERLLGGGLNLEGEEKDVAVLFSDLRDFTSLSEELAPRTVVQILNLYFARMVAVISEEGGVVDKFIGDAIMAYFGAPVELANARESAARAAHRMRAELTDLNKTFASEFGIQLQSGIGLHYGPVVIGNIGSPTRKDFTIIGDTVNIAARLEGLTRSMQSPIILSEEVRKGLTSEHRLIPLEELSLKGRKEPVVCFGAVEPALSD
ncbi:MAG: adenylate/guanylate cyclase domain-containing protein, partial [Leptospiraceae bacterium]|nr:adenylate/guanylate cyclase domain-containing protein [Leptospiraceae bacterium]